jgi:filamentous hemagglutinin family protein
MKNYPHLITLFLCMASLSPNVQGDGGIETDGTVGPKQSLSGTGIDIPQTLGATVGKNLFHSFKTFNINQGQTVTFQENTPNTLDNVISRVTGGTSSEINGSLVSTPGGHANFYLVNPAGVMFGNGASIDVAGDFHVSTADEIRFKDGAVYSASNPSSSSLTAEAPAAFGFSAASLANNSLLTVDGAALSVNPGKTIDLVGGKINVGNGASLTAEGGEVRLVSRQGEDEVSLKRNDDGVLPLPTQNSSITNSGPITVDHSSINTSAEGAGRIAMWGGNINMLNNSLLASQNTGVSPPAKTSGIDLIAMNLLIKSSSRVSCGTLGLGNSSNIVINASGNLDIAELGTITTNTVAAGNAGNIQINANRIHIDGNGFPGNTGIFSGSYGNAIGNAGKIIITSTDKLEIKDLGVILTPTFGIGNGGIIDINSGNLIIIGSASTPFDIKSYSPLYNSNYTGIGSPSLSSGNAGNVTVNTGNISIDGKNSLSATTGISSQVWKGQNGNAGNIIVHSSGDLTIANGGILSSAWGGLNGKIIVSADKSLDMSENSIIMVSNLATIKDPAAANVGSLSVSAPAIDLKESVITSSSSLNTFPIPIFGKISNLISGYSPNANAAPISVSFGKYLAMDHAFVTTVAQGGNGGDITINGGNTGNIILKNSGYITSVQGGSGNGGNINIRANMLFMETAGILANTSAQGGNGGEITITTPILLVTGGPPIIGGNQLLNWVAHLNDFGWNVIQAAAPNGYSGTLNVVSPLNVSGVLVNMGQPSFNPGIINQDFCEVGTKSSSLTRKGHGGLPPKAEDPL